MKRYHCIGLMSGTSLDGLDIASVSFTRHNSNWHFELLEFDAVPYTEKWKSRLRNLTHGTALELTQTHADFGHFLGQTTKNFIDSRQLKVDIVASHGHTIFHQPEHGFTTQIGDGAAIAAELGLPVVCDFRSMDVARGGQGAPLVPIGDALLFGDYKARVNLGGFSNISIGDVSSLEAFDICPVNIVLNVLAQKLGLDFDEDGAIARGGQLLPDLLEKLNQLDFYKNTGPKSLGVEWLEKEVLVLIDSSQKTEDLLRTFVEHAAQQISAVLNRICHPSDRVLFTGGGVYNSFLMERINDLSVTLNEVPSSNIIEMKEAIVFAFLGLLRFLGEENILKSYTGAKSNSVSGALYLA